MKTASLLCAALLLCLPCFPAVAQTGGLDAPGGKVVTVKSEIQRGYAAALKPDLTTGAIKYEHAIRDIEAENEQHNTDSHGFICGLHMGAWAAYWIALDEGVYRGAELRYASLEANSHHDIYEAQRKLLALTADQIKEVAGPYDGQIEDDAWNKAYAAKKFIGTNRHRIDLPKG